LTFKSVISHDSVKRNSYPYSIVVAHLNKDDKLDIVVVNSGTNNIGIFVNYGNATFASHETYSTEDRSRPVSVALGDFNNDTYLDIVVASYDNHNVGILLGYGNGIFKDQTTFSTGSSRPLSLAVGDFNKDSRLEFAVADSITDSIRIFLGSGSKPYRGQTTFFVGNNSHPSAVAVGHFNNDNLLDIAVTNDATHTLDIFLGYGNRMFFNLTTY
jgi:hypothetical protein